MRRQLISGAVVLAVAAGGVAVWQLRSDDTADETADTGPTFVIAPVERRTLVDEVTVRGQIRRDELQRITSPVEGQVSSLLVESGDTVEAGDTILALNGRAGVAVNGTFSFFRQLDVGAEGPDVLQLEEILTAEGFDVGTVDELFTEQTRVGLAGWQAEQGYGGATTENDESVNVSLQNGTGYSVGALSSIGYVVEPADAVVGQVSSMRGPVPLRGRPNPNPNPSPQSTPTSSTSTTIPVVTTTTTLPVPRIEVTVDPGSVAEGAVATFRFRSDIPMPTDTVIDYVVGGDATADDDFREELDGSFVFPAGSSTFDLVVTTLVDDEIESDEELVITVGNGINVDTDARYQPGALKEARLTIVNPSGEMPTVTVRNEQDAISEGNGAEFVFETDKVRNEDTTLYFSISGSAGNTADIAPVEGEIDLPADATEVTLTIDTVADRLVEPDEYLVVTLQPGADYLVAGAPADVVIESSDLPELTLEGGGRVAEGSATTFAIVADQAPVEDTSVAYSLGGGATPGIDYEALTGTVVLPAGQRRVEITIATIDDDVVFRPGDMIVADWPARIGSVAIDEGEFVLLGAELLTLTEPAFTITLQLTPTDRSNLSVGLEATIELQASGQDAVPGVITELDESATIDQAGTETYEGVVETDGVLEAVDGANVNVDVVLERRENVITVPVASVLQDGQGADVVRIVLDDGTTRQVPVEVGLSEGAFVEISDGLVGNELVLVET